MSRCVIFAGADIQDYNLPRTKIMGEDFIICADSGIRHAARLGLTADIWVGDFDSVLELDANSARYIKKTELPSEKDDTDTLSAVRTACELKFSEILLFGATGCRLDHTLANFFLLKFIAENGAAGIIYDEHNEIRLLTNGCIELERTENTFLSVLPFGGDASGVTLSGVKYPLYNAILTMAFPIGISNEIKEKTAIIEVKTGNLLIFLSRD